MYVMMWLLVERLLRCAESETCCLHRQGPEDLFETLSQCLLSGVDRDALSGWGAIVHVV